MNRRAAVGVVGIVLFIGAVLALRAWVVTPFAVVSDSMSPTLAEGSTVLVDRVSPHLGSPDRQDLVLFTTADGPVIKRVVGVGGDTVAMEDSVLIVNGEPVDEPYVDEVTLDGVFYHEVVVPEGYVFVLGDNRFDSVDSRNYGPVPVSAVQGRVMGR